jgi:malic enzyme
MKGADMFMGLSVANLGHARDAEDDGERPIIFALANPDPEIATRGAVAARPDAIVATGRSDFPNQVNNVLGFPYIFRGALDVRATTEINEEMKLAASRALAELTREPSPRRGRGLRRQALRFGATTSSRSRSIRACCGGSRRRSRRPRWSPASRASVRRRRSTASR